MFLAFFICLTSPTMVQGGEYSLVQFAHLEHLTEKILFMGDSVDIVHVYANYPDYNWVAAMESGPEGVACVDDAARAAVVYLRHYELTHDERSRVRARGLLEFILKMQDPDGQFFNFVFADHSINTKGSTSAKSFGWWTGRAIWSMSLGYRLMRRVEPALARRLQGAIDRTLPHIDSLLIHYGEEEKEGSYRIPQWLLYQSAADATTELLLGLVEYSRASPGKKIATAIGQLSTGLMAMQDGDSVSFPYGLHRSWRTMWHMWGNGQTQALASAGRLLGDRSMIGSAEREARWFYSRLLIDGFMKEMDVTLPEERKDFEQIAYGVRPMAVGLIRLYEATGNRDYLLMAGLAASWLTGNNAANRRMYDPNTGRCYDGLTDSTTVNLNSGAESTIEALYTVLEVEQYPEALRCIDFRRVAAHSADGKSFALFRNPAGDEMVLFLDPGQHGLRILEGEAKEDFLRLNELLNEEP
jgi:hypothetical protein